VVVTPSVPMKANSGVRARVPAAGKVLEGDDKPTLLREDQHYLHYITMIMQFDLVLYFIVFTFAILQRQDTKQIATGPLVIIGNNQ